MCISSTLSISIPRSNLLYIRPRQKNHMIHYFLGTGTTDIAFLARLFKMHLNFRKYSIYDRSWHNGNALSQWLSLTMTSRTRYETPPALSWRCSAVFWGHCARQTLTTTSNARIFSWDEASLAETWWPEPHGLRRLCWAPLLFRHTHHHLPTTAPA